MNPIACFIGRYGGAAAAAKARIFAARAEAAEAAVASTDGVCDGGGAGGAPKAGGAGVTQAKGVAEGEALLRLALLRGNEGETGDDDDAGDAVGEECPICLDAVVEVVLPCSHGFCRDCVRSWEGLSSTCPVCRGVTARSEAGEQWELLDARTSTVLERDGTYAAMAASFLEGLSAAADACVRAMPAAAAVRGMGSSSVGGVGMEGGERPFELSLGAQ